MTPGPHRRQLARARASGAALPLLLAGLALALFAGSPARAGAEEPRRVLLLNSYHQGYQWTDEETQGVLAELGGTPRDLQVYIEYMGTKWASGPAYLEQLRQAYAVKFQRVRFDVIVATDDDALEFLLAYRDALFGPVPTVFCGANDFRPERLRGHPGFTGVNEAADYRGGLDLALRLHPGTRRVAVVVDASITGRKIRAEFEAAAAEYAGRLAFEYLDGPLPQVLDRVRQLPPDALVFHLVYFSDALGRIVSNDESAALVSRASPVPVYGSWKFSLGHGIVGGKLLSGLDQGVAAGRMARRLLAGARAEELPVLMESPTSFMFDDAQLRRFRIPRHALPPGSTLVNAPPSFYEVNKTLVWAGAVGVAGLLAAIALLLASAARRRRAEKALRDSEARYRAIVDGFDGLIYLCSPGLQLQFTNARLAARVGDAAGLRCHEALYRQPGPCPWCPMARVAQGEVSRRELHDPVDGRWYHVVASPVRNQDGTVSLQSVALDITDRRRAEDALRASEEKFRTLVENLRIGVFRSTGDRPGRFLQVNPAMERLLGYDPGELLRISVEQLYADPADRGRVLDALRLHGAVRDREVAMRRRDGAPVTTLLTATAVLDADGDLAWVDGTMEDLTERRRMEAELLKTQKLESIGLLAGGIAHDFNNLLTAILGNLSVARSGAGSPPGHDALADAEAAAMRARDLTSRLLTFAKGGAPQRKPVAVADLVRSCSRLALSGSPAACELDLPPDLWPVHADEVQVGQVLNNLVLNASQAMDGGGVVRVRAGNRVVDAADRRGLAPGRYVEIAVRDQGSGIAPDHLEKIFDPFFTTKERGRGLGLSTAYSVVKQHGGLIGVTSAPGQGSTFTVLLPAAGAPGPASAAAPAAAPAGRGRVLVMDDDETVQRAVRRMLERLGYTAAGARDGVEALARYREAVAAGERFDAVIMDLTIPGGMGGKEAVQQLLAVDPRARVLVSSGYSNDPVLSDPRAFGFAGVIGKPFQMSELASALAAVVGAGAAAPAAAPPAQG